MPTGAAAATIAISFLDAAKSLAPADSFGQGSQTGRFCRWLSIGCGRLLKKPVVGAGNGMTKFEKNDARGG
jgi:hypothetical protein